MFQTIARAQDAQQLANHVANARQSILTAAAPAKSRIIRIAVRRELSAMTGASLEYNTIVFVQRQRPDGLISVNMYQRASDASIRRAKRAMHVLAAQAQ